MVSMLRDAIDRGTGSAVRQLGIRFPVGGKTGTTNEFKDAWFVGFSSSVVVGVWVGYDQSETDRRRGVWRAVCAADLGELHAARRTPPPARWSSSVRRGSQKRRCARMSYRKPVDGCPLYTEYFKEGDRDSRSPVHHSSRLDPAAPHPHRAGLGVRSRPPDSRHLPLKRSGRWCRPDKAGRRHGISVAIGMFDHEYAPGSGQVAEADVAAVDPDRLAGDREAEAEAAAIVLAPFGERPGTGPPDSGIPPH